MECSTGSVLPLQNSCEAMVKWGWSSMLYWASRISAHKGYTLVIKSIQKLILPVILFVVSGTVSFEKTAALSSACKDWSLQALTAFQCQMLVVYVMIYSLLFYYPYYWKFHRLTLIALVLVAGMQLLKCRQTQLVFYLVRLFKQKMDSIRPLWEVQYIASNPWLRNTTGKDIDSLIND